MVTVKFINVGRDQKSWTETIPELNYLNLKRAITRKSALMSRNIDFDLGDNDKGIIWAGMRKVGEFEVFDYSSN